MTPKITIANSFFSRLFGLTIKANISESEIFLIPNCKRVHTFFMRFPIDVIFLDKDFNILSIEANLYPWGVSKIVAGTVHIAETKAGESLKNQVAFQDSLKIKKAYLQ